jgi:hypothetical protein
MFPVVRAKNSNANSVAWKTAFAMERITKKVPTVLKSTDIVTLAQVSPPAAKGAGRGKARVLSKQQQG